MAKRKKMLVKFKLKENEELAPIIECASIVDGMKDAPKIIHKKPEAFYVPSQDYIQHAKDEDIQIKRRLLWHFIP